MFSASSAACRNGPGVLTPTNAGPFDICTHSGAPGRKTAHEGCSTLEHSGTGIIVPLLFTKCRLNVTIMLHQGSRPIVQGSPPGLLCDSRACKRAGFDAAPHCHDHVRAREPYRGLGTNACRGPSGRQSWKHGLFCNPGLQSLRRLFRRRQNGPNSE